MSETNTVQVDLQFYLGLLQQVASVHQRLQGPCSCPFCAQARHQERKAA